MRYRIPVAVGEDPYESFCNGLRALVSNMAYCSEDEIYRKLKALFLPCWVNWEYDLEIMRFAKAGEALKHLEHDAKKRLADFCVEKAGTIRRDDLSPFKYHTERRTSYIILADLELWQPEKFEPPQK